MVYLSISSKFAAKPYFIYPLKDLIVDENSDITWRCEGIASPRASYVWYKNARLITSGTDGIEIYSNVLKIKNLQKRIHDGMYSCEATNIHGSSVSSAQLKVLCTSLFPNLSQFYSHQTQHIFSQFHNKVTSFTFTLY